MRLCRRAHLYSQAFTFPVNCNLCTTFCMDIRAQFEKKDLRRISPYRQSVHMLTWGQSILASNFQIFATKAEIKKMSLYPSTVQKCTHEPEVSLQDHLKVMHQHKALIFSFDNSPFCLVMWKLHEPHAQIYTHHLEAWSNTFTSEKKINECFYWSCCVCIGTSFWGMSRWETTNTQLQCTHWRTFWAEFVPFVSMVTF